MATLMAFILALFVFNSRTSHDSAETITTSLLPGSISSPRTSSESTLSALPTSLLPAKIEPKIYQITATETGFLPQTLTIKVGDTVTFINRSSSSIWPAVGPHPTHAVCSGFDSLAGIAPNGTYTYTFTKVATCPFHDHLHAADGRYRGEINIKD